VPTTESPASVRCAETNSLVPFLSGVGADVVAVADQREAEPPAVGHRQRGGRGGPRHRLGGGQGRRAEHQRSPADHLCIVMIVVIAESPQVV
jgi:hypothetical protein